MGAARQGLERRPSTSMPSGKTFDDRLRFSPSSSSSRLRPTFRMLTGCRSWQVALAAAQGFGFPMQPRNLGAASPTREESAKILASDSDPVAPGQ
jgi:hypothetical protein